MLTLEHPITGDEYKLGRKFIPGLEPRLKFRNYVRRALPEPPLTLDGSANALPNLKNVMGNDIAGCCTCSGAFHIDGVLLGSSDQADTLTAEQCLDLYVRLSGWNKVIDDPSDTGLSEHQVLQMWQSDGLTGDGHHTIAGDMGVTPSLATTACWLFGNLYVAMQLPTHWISPMPGGNGFVWDAAGDGDPEAGHAFMAYGYTKAGLLIDSWGMFGIMTWAAVNKYISQQQGGALYTVLSWDAINRATMKAASGFDFTDLTYDLAGIGGPQRRLAA
jgi:hypothetical protein